MVTSAAAMAADDAFVRLRVPLFESLMDSFNDERRHVILDLGPARAGTIDLLSRFRCRLDVLDLPQVLAELETLEEPAAIENALGRLLPPAGKDQVDLVFCWNLLNYLDPIVIAALMRLLTPRLAGQARVHALIEYSATHMPASPGRVAPEDAATLILEPASDAAIKTPRHSRAALEKLMPGFQSERTMLLGNGMQEHLFRRP
jgi:hypothetical protein